MLLTILYYASAFSLWPFAAMLLVSIKYFRKIVKYKVKGEGDLNDGAVEFFLRVQAGLACAVVVIILGIVVPMSSKFNQEHLAVASYLSFGPGLLVGWVCGVLLPSVGQSLDAKK